MPWIRESRRRFLGRITSSALLASTDPLRLLGAVTSNASRPAAPARARAAPGEARVRELADLLRTAPRETVFDLAAQRIRAGATVREMLGGVLLAGVQDVRPWPPGVKFHTVLMGPSVLDLSEAADPADAWLPVFFNIDVLKSSQEQDAREGNWTLPPEPTPATEDPSTARRSLTESLERWDLKAADRSATAAAKLLDIDDLFEILWPFGSRDFANIGHLMIHTAQAHKALQMTAGLPREPVIRSLVHGLLGGAPGKTTAAFERNRRRVQEYPASWEAGRDDAEAGREVLAAMRSATPEAAAELVIALLKRGVSRASIRDGLNLAASEILFRLAGSTSPNAQLLGVHPTTILNAFQHASLTSGREETRRLMLLQSASWLASARDVLRESKGLSMEGSGLDAIVAGEGPVAIEGALEQAHRTPARAVSLTLQAAATGEGSRAIIRRCRELTIRKAPEHHHHKYAAALFDELPRTSPRWAPYLLAVAPTYLAGPDDADSDASTRAKAALAKAKVG